MARKNKNGRGRRRYNNIVLHKNKSRIDTLFDAISDDSDKGDVCDTIEENKDIEVVSKPFNDDSTPEESIKDTDMIKKISDKPVKIEPGYYIKNDMAAQKIINSLCSIKEFFNLMMNIEEYVSYAEGKQVDTEKRRQDIEHNIELKNGNCYEVYCIAIMLKHVLIERRDFKDLMSVLHSVKSFADTHSHVISEVQNLYNKIKQMQKIKENRIYIPKSDLHLPINEDYNNLTDEAKSILELNYSKTRRKYQN